MKTSTKILLGAGAALAAGGWAYYNNAKQLQWSVAGLSMDAQLRVHIRLQVANPSRVFKYPVPALQAALFDSNDNLLGWISSPVWQMIQPGISIIDGIFTPEQNSFWSTITQYAVAQTLPPNITVQGVIMAMGHEVPFSTMVNTGIGKIYKDVPTEFYQCLDGTYSDHNRNRACSWHGGMVDPDNAVQLCDTPTAAGDSALALNDIPVRDIKIYLEKFQNRKNPYSEQSVQRIIDAVQQGTFRFEEFDPVLVWKAPAGVLYILSGHSRLEAFTRLCNSGQQRFCRIPAKVIEVSAAEAEEIALRSNTLSTKETDTERAMYYRKQLMAGAANRVVMETARKNEGTNAARIVSYAYLNPSGKTFTALEALESGDPTSQTIIRAIAQWIGEARMKFPMLSDAHENELYDWLVSGGFGKQYKNKADFLRKLATVVEQRTTFGEFDSSRPLNVFNAVTKSFAERQFDAQEQELKERLAEIEKAIKIKTVDYKSRGASEQQIFELLQNDYGLQNRVRNQLLNLMQKKNEVIEQSKNELALFGPLRRKHSIGSSNMGYRPGFTALL